MSIGFPGKLAVVMKTAGDRSELQSSSFVDHKRRRFWWRFDPISKPRVTKPVLWVVVATGGRRELVKLIAELIRAVPAAMCHIQLLLAGRNRFGTVVDRYLNDQARWIF